MNKKREMNMENAFIGFFRLPDWISRTAFIGVFYIAIMVLYFIASFIMIIPFVGWVIGCFLILLVPVLGIGFNLFLDGYKLEISEAIVKGQPVSEVQLNAKYSSRIKEGFNFNIGNLIYNIPLIVVYIIGYAIYFGGIFIAEESSDPEASPIFLASLLIFLAMLFLGWIYQMLQTYLIIPLIYLRYMKKRTISSMFDFSEMKQYLKKHWMNIVFYGLLMFAGAFIVGLVNIIAAFTIFICIGIILFPITLAVGMTYIVHLQAYLLGEIAASD